MAPLHPGEILQVDYLEPLGVTQHRVAAAAGRDVLLADLRGANVDRSGRGGKRDEAGAAIAASRSRR